ncbi:MAG: hypothetical protein L6V93_09600 [Clostridiales bacterium]|nr:MAG: hypothetical protein L6V93_09600 [Clostridiales bacterium]
MRDVHSTGSVEYSETKVIAKKSSKKTSIPYAKIIGEEKFVVNASKTENADILIVLGA